MNTWIIEPNWLVWGLLIVIAGSLVVCAWGICKIFALKASKNNKGLFSIPPFYKGMVWTIGIIEVLIIGIVGYVVFKNANMTDGSVGGVYMSFFSILITFLVGWQIYNSILSREQIRSISSEIHNKTSKILNYNLFQVFFTQGKNEHKQKNYENAFNYYFRSVDCATKGAFEAELNDVIRKIKELIVDKQAVVGVNDSDVYIRIIEHTSHKDRDFISKRLEEIKSPEATEIGGPWIVTDDSKQ